MSLFLVSRASSALTRSSTALRCCSVACAFSWSCQKLGSLVLASNSASCLRADSASKKAPHKLDAFIQLGEALLQVFDVFGHWCVYMLIDFLSGVIAGLGQMLQGADNVRAGLSPAPTDSTSCGVRASGDLRTTFREGRW